MNNWSVAIADREPGLGRRRLVRGGLGGFARAREWRMRRSCHHVSAWRFSLQQGRGCGFLVKMHFALEAGRGRQRDERSSAGCDRMACLVCCARIVVRVQGGCGNRARGLRVFGATELCCLLLRVIGGVDKGRGRHLEVVGNNAWHSDTREL